MKFSRKLIFALIIFLLVSITICYNLNPFRGSQNVVFNSKEASETITKKQALEDINYVEKIIKERHIASLEGLPNEFLVQVEEEKSNLSDNITVLELWQAIGRILSKLKDAHTSIKLVCDNEKRASFDFKMEDKDLYVIDNYGNKKPVFKINNKDVFTLYEEFISKFSFENEDYARNAFESYLKSFNGICFVLNELLEKDFITIETVSSEDKSKIVNDKIEYDLESNEDFEKINEVEYSIDYEKSAAVIAINTCIMNEEYKSSLKNFFSALKDNSITNIAVDLRNNSGGNSAVIEEFIKYVDIDNYKAFSSVARYGPYTFKNSNEKHNKKYNDFLYKGNIYVLSSSKTFSSGMMFSVTLQDNNIAKVIGEPSSNSPCSYGDVINFCLPNSKLLLKTSYKKFIRPDTAVANESIQRVDYNVKSNEALDMFYEIISKKDS